VPAGHLHRPTPSGLPHLVAEVRPRLGRRYRAPRAGQQLLPAVQMLDQTAQGDRQQPPRARPRRRWSPERPPACARRGRRPGRRAARSDRPHRPVEPRLARRISFCTDLRGTLPAAVRTAGRQQVKATIRTRLDRDPPSGLASVMKAASLGRGPRPSDAHEHDRRSPRQRVQVPSPGEAGKVVPPLPCADAYPPGPRLRPLPEFSGTAKPRPDPTLQARVEAFIVEQYAAGRSLRQLAELTDQSFSAVGTSSPGRCVHRRGAGALALPEPGN
jgi:hypothetical protein